MEDGFYEKDMNALCKKFKKQAQDLVNKAAEAGVVITVTQVPMKPLRMGNYVSIAETRPDRKASVSIMREREINKK